MAENTLRKLGTNVPKTSNEHVKSIMKDLGEIESLENFVLNNPELDKLESLLSDFNIFEILNMTFAEIRHSNVLAWLLNPGEHHGLASYFIRQFLKYIVSVNRSYFSSSELSLFDFELFNYSNVQVRREWNNIDILIVIIEDDKKLVITIENKIKTSEQSGQLQRYRGIVQKEFKDFIRLYVYLTPDNMIPSDDEWIPFGYDTVADLLDDLLEFKKNSLNPNIFFFVQQYQTILRRYIVGNSEVEKIAVDIYKKHKQALDIIFQYRPDIYNEIGEHLQAELKNHDEIIIDSAGKTLIRFTTNKIDGNLERVGEGWTKSKRIVLFEINIYEDRVALRLYVGPGDVNYRERLLDFFLKDKKLFKLADRKFGAKWHAMYQKEFLRKKDFEDEDTEAMKNKLNEKLANFIDNDLPKIHAHFQTFWRT